jgi:drug/metabolite transporter (DMT)-like permease
MELSRAHGFELGQNGLLVVIALAALFGAPLAFGRFIARRTQIPKVHPVALGALAGCGAVWVVPVVLFTLADPEGGLGPAAIAAILAVMVGWCVAVAAGTGAYLDIRDRKPAD